LPKPARVYLCLSAPVRPFANQLTIMLLAVNTSYQPSDYLPIVIQFGLAVAFVAFAMVVSHLVGPKRQSKVKDASFECGIESVGNARNFHVPLGR
jgi:hypothetical protein